MRGSHSLFCNDSSILLFTFPSTSELPVLQEPQESEERMKVQKKEQKAKRGTKSNKGAKVPTNYIGKTRKQIMCWTQRKLGTSVLVFN